MATLHTKPVKPPTAEQLSPDEFWMFLSNFVSKSIKATAHCGANCHLYSLDQFKAYLLSRMEMGQWVEASDQEIKDALETIKTRSPLAEQFDIVSLPDGGLSFTWKK